jgi:hypothetical protein
MRYLLFIIAFLGLSITSTAQVTGNQTIGNSKTMITALGGLNVNGVSRVWSTLDTNQAKAVSTSLLPLKGRTATMGTTLYVHDGAKFQAINGGDLLLACMGLLNVINTRLTDAARDVSDPKRRPLAVEQSGSVFYSRIGLDMNGCGNLDSTTLSKITKGIGDTSSTNEIQVLSINNGILSLSNGGGSVTLPSGGGGGATPTLAQVVAAGNTYAGAIVRTTSFSDTSMRFNRSGRELVFANIGGFPSMISMFGNVRSAGYSIFGNNYVQSAKIVLENDLAQPGAGLMNLKLENVTGTFNALFPGKSGTVAYNSGETHTNATLAGTVQMTGIVEYADNAAAKAAGLTNGRVYRTGDLLKIVHD